VQAKCDVVMDTKTGKSEGQEKPPERKQMHGTQAVCPEHLLPTCLVVKIASSTLVETD
jgi:hypothetical protein